MTFRPARSWAAPLALVLASAASHAPAASAAAPVKSIILVSIDDLRWDEAKGVSFERLRRESVEFTGAQTPATWTLPAHASMFTSLSPAAHGAGGDALRPLPAWAPFLPALLARRGYRTGAFVQAGFLDRSFGFARGFDAHVFDGPRRSTATFPAALAWLKERSAEPLFLFVHTSAVHRAERLSDSTPRSGPFRCPLAIDFARAFPAPPEMTYTPASCRQARYDYENAIACLDIDLAAFLAGVDAALDPKTTLLVVTSDHGESLCERGDPRRRGHRGLPYEEQSRVPLFVRFPAGAGAGTRRSEPVSLIDVSPTILAQAGAPLPGAFEGRALDASAPGPADRPLFAEDDAWSSVWRAGSRFISLAGGKTALWRDGHGPDDGDVGKALARLLELHGTEARASRRRLEAEARYTVAPSTGPLPDPVREALRFAGYLP